MRYFIRSAKFFVFLGVFIFIGGFISMVSLFYYYSKDLPQLESLKDYNPPVVSEVFSHNGTKIGEFWTEKRYLLNPQELPKAIIQAVVASEDDRFFKHKGIDYPGIVRAFFENLRAGRVVQGGSTITQQVTKSLLLSRERTLSRKIKEAILATRIEQKFSKEEILYLYLNQTFFGNRSYGIEAAAINYFHKTSRELNIAEAALIAGLAKAPSTYSPLHDPEKAKQRQEYVIDRMFETGSITKEQAVAAKAFPLKIYQAKTDKEYNYQYAPWFTEYIRRMIQQKYGEQVPYTHGLKIYTTVDLNIQKAAQDAVDKGLRELDHRQGYSGPLRQIKAESIERYSIENHTKILQNSPDHYDYMNPPSEDEIYKITTPLDSDKYYEAVITDVNRTEQNLEVLVGNVSGIIRVHDYKWARHRNLNTTGYSDIYYIKDPSQTFNVGDVIIVRLKDHLQPQLKDKGYQPNKTYFTLEQTPEAEGALFSYEPETGFVRAMVGGRDFNKSEFNRAMQALRQTGSVFKPLLYSAALDKGYTPSTIIEDAPVYYEYSPGRFWSPQNYGGGFKGPTPFRNALVNSRNVVSVRILMDIGTEFVGAYARKLGITSPLNRYYSMALGANDMKLYEVCRAFGTFATGGVLPELVYITKITDRYGRILEEHQPRQIVPFTEQKKPVPTEDENAEQDAALVLNPENDQNQMTHQYNQKLLQESEEWINKDKLQLNDIEKQILYGDYIPDGYAISPKTAYTMMHLLNDVVNYGTGYKVKELQRPAAGKTGTTNDESDAWFIGFTPKLFAGTWVGFDQVKKLGGRETGGKTAAPIFLYFMQEALKDQPVASFQFPNDIELSGFDAPIDSSIGDAEAGGISDMGSGADFFIYDF